MNITQELAYLRNQLNAINLNAFPGRDPDTGYVDEEDSADEAFRIQGEIEILEALEGDGLSGDELKRRRAEMRDPQERFLRANRSRQRRQRVREAFDRDMAFDRICE